MDIAPFAIEQFFDRYEFTTPHVLCSSDCESMSIGELLALAGVEGRQLHELRLGYTEAQGGAALRAAIAAQYESVYADEVIVLGSPEEGIFLTLMTLLEPEDHVVAMAPAYESLINVAQHVTDNVVTWLVRPTSDAWQANLAELEQLVTTETRAVVINLPHNPTGYLPSPATFGELVKIATRHGAWLFCDEMYRGLELGSAPQLPSAADVTPRAIVLAGLSKVHGLPGLRAGWLIVRERELRERLINWKHYTSICPPAPSEFLSQVALRAHDQLVAANRSLVARNVSLATEFFARWPDLFTWRPPLAGSVALVGLNASSATEYCHRLAAEAGVLLLPSSCLGYGDAHVRFGFGRADFATGLGRLETYLQKTETPKA